MGVDLRLLPLLSKDFWCAHEVWSCERRRDLWDEVLKLPQQPIPEKLSCYLARHPIDGETCYGDIEEDPYGCRPHYTTAGDLLTLKDNHEVRDNWKNRAIWAALGEMPADWPIVLYWH